MIATTAMTPASTKGGADQPPGFLDRYRRAGNVRRDRAYRRDEPSQRSVVARVAPRERFRRGRKPVRGRSSCSAIRGGNVSSVTGPAVNYEAQHVKALLPARVIRSRCNAGIIASAALRGARREHRRGAAAALRGPTAAASRAATGCSALRRSAIAATISARWAAGSVASGRQGRAEQQLQIGRGSRASAPGRRG